MHRFSVDYNGLENKLLKKSYRLSEVKDRLEKVAFDIVRFKDSDKASELWQIQSADDGDYIVSLYEDSEETKVASNHWEVVLSKTANVLNVFYKGDPIVKVAARTLGLPETELSLVEQYLPEKLNQNPKLVQALLAELPEAAKKSVLTRYPELQS